MLVFTTLSLAGMTTASLVQPVYEFGLRAPALLNDTCNTDQNAPPRDLTTCGNSTLFFTWRPKARFIAPEGWMNDPQGQNIIISKNGVTEERTYSTFSGLFQRADGSFHAGYQCHPQVSQSYCNVFIIISDWTMDSSITNGETFPNALLSLMTWPTGEMVGPQSTASSRLQLTRIHSKQLAWSKNSCTSLTFPPWNSFDSALTRLLQYPSQIYDIGGVFDGSIIKNGWNGYPTTIYTSVFPAPLGAISDPAENPGTETQSIAYTKDGGATWIKLNFGQGANPVICKFPFQPHPIL